MTRYDSHFASGRRPVESLAVATALRLFFLGTSVALGFSLSFVGEVSELALKNSVAPETRKALLYVSLAGGLITTIAGALFVLWSRHRAALVRLNQYARLASPLLLSAALPYAFDWRVFKNREFLCAVVATLLGLGCERAFRASVTAALELGLTPGRRLSQDPVRGTTALADRFSTLVRFLRRRGPELASGLLMLAFSVYVITYSVQQHYQLKTYSWDLGIFNNLMYNLLRGHWFKASPVLGPTGSHLQFHATFAAYLLAPIYALWQRPETLLVLQVLLVMAGAVPLFLLARLRLQSGWVALAFVYAYLIHAPLQAPLFYDFHFLTISPAFVLTTLYCFETGRRRALLVAWLLAISVREEVSATLAIAALYYLLRGQRPRLALWGGLLSTLYFLVVKFVVMPAHGQTGESFSWLFQELIAPGDKGFGGVLRTLVTSPIFVFSKVFLAEKFEYVLCTLGPLLLLPVRHPLTWVLCVPAFMFTMLSTGYQPLLEPRFQYTANWTPYIMLASIFCLRYWKDSAGRWVHFAAAVPALCFSATLFSYHFGAVYQHNTFVGGFNHVEFGLSQTHRRDYNDLKALISQIPDTASVSACELIVPHVSSRENAYTLNRTGSGGADYLLCNADWLSRAPVKGFMQTALATHEYSFVGRRGGFALWRKGGDHSKDAEGLQLLSRPPTPAKTKPPVPPAAVGSGVTAAPGPGGSASGRASTGASEPPTELTAPTGPNPAPSGSGAHSPSKAGTTGATQAPAGMDAMPAP